MTSPSELTNERKSTHGDWKLQSSIAFSIKDALRDGAVYRDMSAQQREAIDMIAVKLSRIVCGNPNEPDHWDDIAGYAFLGKGGHKTEG